MLRVTIFSLVCLMVLGNVIARDLELPRIVNGRKFQCQARGHDLVGACVSQNLADDNSMECRYLTCAVTVNVSPAWKPGSRIGVEYEARPTGPPLDGTECAAGKVCRNRECVWVGLENVPTQLGPGIEYSCQSPAYRALVRYPQVTPETPRAPRPAPTRRTVIVSPRKHRNNGRN